MKVKYSFLVPVLFIFGACGSDSIPKPKAMLRLEYPPARYEVYKKESGYQFEKNRNARVSEEKNEAFNLEYPAMKATLFITHKKVENNIGQLLTDAQKLTYEHVIKADAITEYPFVNPDDNVYGMLYEVSGNAASQFQFYATDSTTHFLAGSLYFYARPNYDSILPAAAYMKNDIQRIMESLRWEE